MLTHKQKLKLARRLEKESGGHKKGVGVFQTDAWRTHALAVKRKIDKREAKSKYKKFIESLKNKKI